MVFHLVRHGEHVLRGRRQPGLSAVAAALVNDLNAAGIRVS